MDFNIDVRRKQLNSLDQFIKSSKENFDSILKALNWTESVVEKEHGMVSCTINPDHKIPSNTLDEHVKQCILRQEKYLDSARLLSEPLRDKLASVYINKQEKTDLFTKAAKNDKEFKSVWKKDEPDPKSADRLYCTYSPDERRILYEHCVASTSGPEKLPDFNIFKLFKDKTGVALTADEERARERDMKRRSFKYKKTYTSRDRDPLQVMREVIDGQMELYREWLTARDQTTTETHANCDVENIDVKATDQRKGPRTPEHEAPDDELEYNGNGRHDDVDDSDRRESRHSSRLRFDKRDQSRSPQRRRSREYQNRRRYKSRSRSRSRSPRGGSRYNSYNNHRSERDGSRDRSRDKRKSYSSRRGDGDGNDSRRRERTRSRSPRSARGRR